MTLKSRTAKEAKCRLIISPAIWLQQFPGTPLISNADPLLKAIKNFLLNKELPQDPKCQQLVKLFSNDCFIEDDIIWRRIKRQFEPSRVVIFLPASLTQQALVDAHGNELVGHDGIYKTKERLSVLLLAWDGR